MPGDIPDNHPAMLVLRAAAQSAFAAALLYSKQNAEWRDGEGDHGFAARMRLTMFVEDELDTLIGVR